MKSLRDARGVTLEWTQPGLRVGRQSFWSGTWGLDRNGGGARDEASAATAAIMIS